MSHLFSAWLSRRDIQLFAVCVVLLTLFPAIDLAVSGVFYDPETQSFPLGDTLVPELLYKLFAKLHLLLLPLLIFMAIRRKRENNPYRHRRLIYAFLLFSLILGPGILVNTIAKDSSIGRARPVQVEQFGGESKFTAPFVYSGACERNCSFVSGHAALGFFFIGLGWWFRSRRAFYLGFGIGCALGLTRIVQGGHFFSDVVFAFWAVYFVNLLLGRWMGFTNPLEQD